MADKDFQGNIYDLNTNQFSGSEVKYQGFFYKINSGSSPSSWSGVRTSQFGQFAMNLGDGDWVTQDGTALPGDKVLIVFWVPNTTSDRESLTLTQWGMAEFTLTSDQTYTRNVQVLDHQAPTCSFSINTVDTVNTDIIITDIGTNDDYSWTFQSETMYQVASRYGESIYLKNDLPDLCIDIDWDDGTINTVTDGSAYSHQYTSKGDYEISVTVTNRGGLTCNTLFSKRIYWREPVANFSISDATPSPEGENGLGELVTFINTSTDPDGRRNTDNWYYDWTLNDTGSYGNFTQSYTNVIHSVSPDHQWRNPGNNDIDLVLHWYDGFDWQTVSTTKSINQNTWNVSNGLNWPIPVVVNEPTLYTPDISGATTHIKNVDYYVDTIKEFDNLGVTESFYYTFTVSQSHIIQQCIEYHDGFSLQEQCQNFTVGMDPVASYRYEESGCGLLFTSTGVAGTPPITNYYWEVLNSDGEIVWTKSSSGAGFDWSYPYVGTFTIKHKISDFTQDSDFYSQDFSITECPAGDGSGTGQEIFGGGGFIGNRMERPKIKVVKVEEECINIEIKVLPLEE